jgi:hypothetical protein
MVKLKNKARKPMFYVGAALGIIGAGANTVLAWTSLLHAAPVGTAHMPAVVVSFTAVAALGMWLFAIGGGFIVLRRKHYGR